MNFIHQPFKKGLNLLKNLPKNSIHKSLRTFSNENENNVNTKPFALFDQQSSYILPNPFKLLFQKLNLRWEMSRIDPSFNLEDFYNGTKMALVAVSSKIAKGDFDNLEEMIKPGLVDSIKIKYQRLTQNEKDKILISSNGVFNQAICDFNIHTNGTTGNTVVKIKLQFILLPNADEIRSNFMNFNNPSFKNLFESNLKIISMADYAFTRDYSKDFNQTKWLIYELNHYNWDYINNIPK